MYNVLISTVQQVIQLYTHTDTHTFFLEFFSIMSYHRLLNIVPGAI